MAYHFLRLTDCQAPAGEILRAIPAPHVSPGTPPESAYGTHASDA